MPPKAVANEVTKKAFRERLKFLIGEAKPYSWCKKVGIEKGLFQYYWQMGNIPKYDNLLKIRAFTGCSLDWLLTGEGEPFPETAEGIEAEMNKLHALQMEQADRLWKLIQKFRSKSKGLKPKKKSH